MANRFTNYGATGDSLRQALGSVGDMVQRKKMLADQIQAQKELKAMDIEAFKSKKKWEIKEAKGLQEKESAFNYVPTESKSIYGGETTRDTFVNKNDWRDPLRNPSSEEGMKLQAAVKSLANPELTDQQFLSGINVLTKPMYMMNSDDDFWDSKKNRRKSKETIATLSSYISLIKSKRPDDKNVMQLEGLLGQLEKTAIEKDLYYSPEEVEKRRKQSILDRITSPEFGRGL